jgi:hypothetical protein
LLEDKTIEMNIIRMENFFNFTKEVAMERVLRGKVGPIASLFVIITFGILLGVTTVIAQETEEIAPDQGFDIITILQGQSASVSVSQSTNYGFHTVFVTTIGNSSLTAALTPKAGAGTGWWTLMVIGARSRLFADFAFGLIPWTGNTVTIDIPSPGFGLVLTSVFYTVLPEGGGGYTIAVRP